MFFFDITKTIHVKKQKTQEKKLATFDLVSFQIRYSIIFL
jgi:hypothetical protein